MTLPQPVALPPLRLQKTFAGQVAVIVRLREAGLISLAKLDSLFASLQHRAFRGELAFAEAEQELVAAGATS